MFTNRPQKESWRNAKKWFGDIPDYMELVRNKYLFQEINERSYGNHEELLTVSQYTGVVKRTDVLKNEKDIITNAESLDGYKIVKKGDLVINIMLAWNGSLGVSPYDGIVSPAYCAYRLKEKMNPWYFHHLFRTDLYKSYFKVHSAGIVDSRLRLYTANFFGLKSIVPTHLQQNAIVKFLNHKLSQIDKYIASKEKLIVLLVEKKISIINKIMTSGLNQNFETKYSKFCYPKKIPSHWIVAPVYSRFDVQLGKMLDSSRITGNYLYPYLRNCDVQWDSVRTYDLPVMDFNKTERDKFSLKKGDLLICEGGEAGRTAIWNGEMENCYYQKAIHRLRPKNNNVNPRFFLYLMFNAVKNRLFSSSFEKSTIEHLTAEKFRRQRFAFPPSKEQDEIVEFLDEKCKNIDDAVQSIKKQISLMKEFRTAFIADAVTGKIDVTKDSS